MFPVGRCHPSKRFIEQDVTVATVVIVAQDDGCIQRALIELGLDLA
jgi:hypothetical protein